uniref:Uncharacterized protein n=1 Tax=Setaria digitata TaxID=48799 RepID=A0A915Q574_9BILA
MNREKKEPGEEQGKNPVYGDAEEESGKRDREIEKTGKRSSGRKMEPRSGFR